MYPRSEIEYLYASALRIFALVMLSASLFGCATDVVCDAQGCISQSKFQANIVAALKDNSVGYVVYVSDLPPAFGGQARTSADSFPIAMLPDLVTNVASVSKTLTTVAVLQSLSKHGLTID